MSRYRNALPQLDNELFMTDGGMETTFVFHDGLELPHFASCVLLHTDEGRAAIRNYFHTYAEIMKRHGVGFIIDTTTWRANPDWGPKLGYSPEELDAVNRETVQFFETLREECGEDQPPVVISACVGPRGDGYVADGSMSSKDAEDYHRAQIETFAGTNADMVSGLTLNYAEEAIGIANAAKQAEMPVVISFTVETDGRLPNEQSLQEAIEQVDQATSGYPAYFMINCAHPTHFDSVLTTDDWAKRIRGIRANASRMSHEELDNSEELDTGDPEELGCQYVELKQRLPHLNIMGGCCGTDHRHIEQIISACGKLF